MESLEEKEKIYLRPGSQMCLFLTNTFFRSLHRSYDLKKVANFDILEKMLFNKPLA